METHTKVPPERVPAVGDVVDLCCAGGWAPGEVTQRTVTGSAYPGFYARLAGRRSGGLLFADVECGRAWRWPEVGAVQGSGEGLPVHSCECGAAVPDGCGVCDACAAVNEAAGEEPPPAYYRKGEVPADWCGPEMWSGGRKCCPDCIHGEGRGSICTGCGGAGVCDVAPASKGEVPPEGLFCPKAGAAHGRLKPWPGISGLFHCDRCERRWTAEDLRATVAVGQACSAPPCRVCGEDGCAGCPEASDRLVNEGGAGRVTWRLTCRAGVFTGKAMVGGEVVATFNSAESEAVMNQLLAQVDRMLDPRDTRAYEPPAVKRVQGEVAGLMGLHGVASGLDRRIGDLTHGLQRVRRSVVDVALDWYDRQRREWESAPALSVLAPGDREVARQLHERQVAELFAKIGGAL